MAFRTFAGLLLGCWLSTLALAEDIALNPAHPEQYTVIPGDTLWDIAGKFLRHPSQWPELWRHNTQISNPHLIYPGDTLYLAMVNGKPQLNLSRPASTENLTPTEEGPCILREEDLKNGRSKFPVKDGKLQPCIRETTLDQAIDLIPMDKIAKYLSSPSVVGATDLENAPYVIAFGGEHLIAGAGDRLYVRAIPGSENLAYTIYRAGDVYKDGNTGEVLGYEAKYVADATLQQAGDPATMLISKSTSEIRVGDRVMPNAEQEVTLNYFPRPPEKPIEGNIISVLDGVTQIGQFNVVVIDKGSRDGLKVGHELEIYQNGKLIPDHLSKLKNDMVKLPNEQAGVVMIFRPFERISYALVMKAYRAIHVSDKVQTH